MFIMNMQQWKVFSVWHGNVDSEVALQMSFSSYFQTFGAATQIARLSVSVRVHGTGRRGASPHRLTT